MKKLFFELENEPISGLTHFIGFLLAIAGLVLLIVFASKYGTAWHVVSFTIFGTSMVFLYAGSTLYHFFPINTKAKKVFHRIDHSMIYFLIAGTYTPLCLVTLRGPWGWTLFGIVWAIAATGISLKAAGVRINPTLSLVMYVLMGWILLIAYVPLRAALPESAIFFLLLGGIFYTIGAVAFAFNHIRFHKRWFGMHEIFHIFVMLGSASHFWFVFHYLL